MSKEGWWYQRVQFIRTRETWQNSCQLAVVAAEIYDCFLRSQKIRKRDANLEPGQVVTHKPTVLSELLSSHVSHNKEVASGPPKIKYISM